MAPPPRASMSGAASLVANQGPSTLISKVWRRWLGREVMALRGRSRPRAALLIEDVEAAEALLDVVEEAVDVVEVAEVGLEGDGLDAELGRARRRRARRPPRVRA